MNVKAPIKCLGCDMAIHVVLLEYHEIREGVTLMKWNRKTVWYHPSRVQPDIHSSVKVPGNNSQDDREKGTWEVSSEENDDTSEEEKSGTKGEEC